MSSNKLNQNCIICAEEFSPSSIKDLKLKKINASKYKVCLKCLESSDPNSDYEDVKKIISDYKNISNIKIIFSEVKEMISSIDIEK